jgi:hypothetical protein
MIDRHSEQSEESRRGDSLFDKRFFAILRQAQDRLLRMTGKYHATNDIECHFPLNNARGAVG